MVNFKTMSIAALGNMVALGLVLLVVVGVLIGVVGPILTIALPHIFGTGGLSLTNALLLLILVRLHNIK